MRREDVRQQNRRVLVIVITIFVLLFVAALIRMLTTNDLPRLSGARCGISTARALRGLSATIAVISASSANSS